MTIFQKIQMFPEVGDSTIEDFCGVNEKTEQLQRSFGTHNLELLIPEVQWIRRVTKNQMSAK
jgi:hypothetical protein